MRGVDVRICENPVVVAAAADALGPACPALVCTGGQPSAAVLVLVLVLLRSLTRAGARLSHHGDFDWGGVRIGTSCTRGCRRWGRGGSAPQTTKRRSAPPAPR